MAQIYLRVMYQSGEYGVEKDAKEGFRWWLKAAEQGDGYAQTKLGGMYFDGEGVEKDDKEAVKWYRKAAEQGYQSAQWWLGRMYESGDGVLKDDVIAYAWYNINGNELTKKYKDVLAKKMTPEDISKAQALSKEMVKKNPKLIKKP